MSTKRKHTHKTLLPRTIFAFSLTTPNQFSHIVSACTRDKAWDLQKLPRDCHEGRAAPLFICVCDCVCVCVWQATGSGKYMIVHLLSCNLHSFLMQQQICANLSVISTEKFSILLYDLSTPFLNFYEMCERLSANNAKSKTLFYGTY